MSKRCELTGTSPLKGNNVSHAKNKTKRRFLPNLKKVTFKSDLLKKNIKLNVTNAALRTVDYKGGFDKFLLSAKKIKIIGVGGIDSGSSAFEKIAAGADLIQLYTGMVYKGPGVVKEIKKELISILKNKKIKNIREAVGINA